MANHTTIRFRDLPNNIAAQEFPGPDAGGTRTRLLSMFVYGRTANHAIYSYQTTTNRVWEWDVPLKNLSSADKTTLEDLITLHLLGPSTQFIYRHTNGLEYTARCLNVGDLEFPREAQDLYSFDLKLAITEQIDLP